MIKLFKTEAKYPFKDFTQFLIGCIMYLLSFLIVPWILIYGYVLRVYRNTISKKETFPLFNDFKNLVIDGLKASFVALAYIIIPIVIFLTSLFLMINNYSTPVTVEQFNRDYALLVNSPLMVFVEFLFFLGGFFVPIALINLSKKGELKSAFNLKKLLLDINKVMPAYLILYLIIELINYLLNLLPYDNYLFTLIQTVVGFYLLVYSARLFAKIYKKNVNKRKMK